MDETGANIGSLSGELVIIPCCAKELYTSSPDNRVTVSVVETINMARALQAPFIIVPGLMLMND